MKISILFFHLLIAASTSLCWSSAEGARKLSQDFSQKTRFAKKKGKKTKKAKKEDEDVPVGPYDLKLRDPVKASTIDWFDIQEQLDPSATINEVTMAVIDEVYDGLATRESIVFFFISELCDPVEEDLVIPNQYVDYLELINPEGFDSFTDMQEFLKTNVAGVRKLQFVPPDNTVDFDALFAEAFEDLSISVANGSSFECSGAGIKETCTGPGACSTGLFCSFGKCSTSDVEGLYKNLLPTPVDTSQTRALWTNACSESYQADFSEVEEVGLLKNELDPIICGTWLEPIFKFLEDNKVPRDVGYRLVYLVFETTWNKVFVLKKGYKTKNLTQEDVFKRPEWLEYMATSFTNPVIEKLKTLIRPCVIWDDPLCDTPDNFLNDSRFFEYVKVVESSKAQLKRALQEYQKAQIVASSRDIFTSSP